MLCGFVFLPFGLLVVRGAGLVRVRLVARSLGSVGQELDDGLFTFSAKRHACGFTHLPQDGMEVVGVLGGSARGKCTKDTGAWRGSVGRCPSWIGLKFG